jgi:ATP phosphoribosyltransferase
VDLGVTGLDVLAEKMVENDAQNNSQAILTLHDALGFGPCSLNLAVPEESPAHTLADLAEWARTLAQEGHSLRIATKFPHLTGQFLDRHNVRPYQLIPVEGTLEIAPAIGYADLISDLVSSGITLRDNHLRPLEGGLILRSQACLIANRLVLKSRPDVLAVAHELLEYIEAHQRAAGSYLLTANMRGDSPEAIAHAMFDKTSLGGLQGPTIAPVVVPPHLQKETKIKWYAVNVVVRKEKLFQAIAEIRSIGGSGVIVSPLTYIFEEEPERYQAMLAALGD